MPTTSQASPVGVSLGSQRSSSSCHAIVPHLDSPEHPESELVVRVAARYDADGTPYAGLRDGAALVVDGAVPELI